MTLPDVFRDRLIGFAWEQDPRAVDPRPTVLLTFLKGDRVRRLRFTNARFSGANRMGILRPSSWIEIHDVRHRQLEGIRVHAGGRDAPLEIWAESVEEIA